MKKMMLALGCVGLCASFAMASSTKPIRSHKVEATAKLDPVRMARIHPDGSMGPWVAYGAAGAREAILDNTLTFDTYEPDVDGTLGIFGAGSPIGGDTCGLGPDDGSTGRWILGGSAVAFSLVANGMSFDPACGGEVVTDMAFAWTWPVAKNLAIIVELHEGDELNDVDVNPCVEPDYAGDFLGGIIFDFGPVGAAAGYYVAAPEDIDFLGVTMPFDGSGYWILAIGTYPTGGDPAGDFALSIDVGGCCGTQPAWWSAGDNEDCEDGQIYMGGPSCGVKDTVGRAGDDVLVVYLDGGITGIADGAFELDGDGFIDECFGLVYGDGFCPDPLSPMLALWTACEIVACSCPVDFNGDCKTNQQDLGALLAVFGKCPNDPGYDPALNLDADPCINQSDLGVLLAAFGCDGN
jgi:hypothetical protein